MITFTRTCTDEGATAALAAGLADVLAPGDVITLEGDLGAGKTTFTRELATALGVPAGSVSSPTFVIVNIYPVPTRRDGLARLVHIDAYRVTSDEYLEPLGWDQLFDANTKQAARDAIAIVEWPGNVAHAMPAENARVHIRIRATGQHAREFSLSFPDDFRSRKFAEWLIDRPPIRCPKTTRWTKPTAPTYPFFDKRAQDSDLFGWLTDSYNIATPPKEE